MSHRNELPQSGWNLPPGCSDYDIEVAAGSLDDEVSICPGYGEGFICKNEKDYDADLCDECLDAANLDAREAAEARAWREGEDAETTPYPHLTDQENF